MNNAKIGLPITIILCWAFAWTPKPSLADNFGEELGSTVPAPLTKPGMGCYDDPNCQKCGGAAGTDARGDQGHNDPATPATSSATAANPIHLFTGRKFESVVDMVVDGVFPIRVVRMYDSQSTYDSPLGYGWSLNLFQAVYRMADGSITVRTRCGAQDRYLFDPNAPTGTNPYSISDPEHGRRPELEAMTGGGYKLTAPTSFVSEFDAEGRLRVWRSAAGHELRFTYVLDANDVEVRKPLAGVSPFVTLPDKVLQVANNYQVETVAEYLRDGTATGRFITLNYDSDSGRLIGITSFDGQRTVSYDHAEPPDPTAPPAPTAQYKGGQFPYRGNLTKVTGLEGIVSEYRYKDLDTNGQLRDVHNLTTKQVGAGTAPFWIFYNDEDRVVQEIHADVAIDGDPLSDPRRTEWSMDWATWPFTQNTRILTRRIVEPSLQLAQRFDESFDTVRIHERELLFDATTSFVREVKERETTGASPRFHRKIIYERNAEPSNALVSEVRTCASDSSCSATGDRAIQFTYDSDLNLATRVVTTPQIIGSTLLGDERITNRWTYDGNWVNRHSIEIGAAGAEQVMWARRTIPDLLGQTTAARISSIVQEGLTALPDQTTTLAYDAGTGLLKSTTLPETGSGLEDRLRISRAYFDSMNGGTAESIGRILSIGLETQSSPIPNPSYSADGHLTRSFAYDSRGFINKITDARGNETLLTLDDLGRVTKIEVVLADDGAGTPTQTEITRLTYSGPNIGIADPTAGPPGRLLVKLEVGATGGSQTVAAAGVIQYFIYDARENLVQIQEADPQNAGQFVVTRTFLYDSDGNRLLAEDAGRAGQSGSLDVTPQRTAFEYDTLGRLTAVVDDRIEADGMPTGNRTEFDYDAHDNPIEVRSDVTGASRHTRFTYDNLDRLRLVDGPGATEAERLITEFQYDVSGNVTKVVEPGTGAGRTTNYLYDELGRLTEVQQPSYNPGSSPEMNYHVRYEYDIRNRLSRITNGRQNVLEHRYEPWGGLSAIDHFSNVANADAGTPLVKSVTYSYDLMGNLLSTADSQLSGISTGAVVTPEGTLLANRLYSFSYDARNRVDTTTAHYVAGISSLALDSNYDARGNRVRLAMTEDTGTPIVQSWCFESGRNRLASIRPPGTTSDCTTDDPQEIALSYYPNDDLKTLARGSGLVSTIEYEPNGPINHIGIGVGNPADLLDLVYTVDNLLAVNTIAESDNGTGAGLYDYDHDAAQRLTRAILPSLPQEDYTYDSRGNRTVLSSYQYDDNNRITKAPNRGYAYDDDGNLAEINDGLATPTTLSNLTFDTTNRLKSHIDQASSVTTTFDYDPFGRRIRKSVSGGPTAGTTAFVWDGDQLLAEYSETGASASRAIRYVSAGGFAPLQMVVEGATPTTYEVHTDHLGTPRMLTDAANIPVWRAAYSSFGSAQVSTDPDGNGATPDPGLEFNIRFPGQYYDEETGLHYNRFRYYDPSVGRYISGDPIGQLDGPNLYAYAANSPTRYVDPVGLFRFGKRPLGGGTAPWVPGGSSNPIDDITNTEISHEQGFFEDGSGENIGFGPEGRFSEDPDGLGYRYDEDSYDDALMRRALENVPDGEYSLLGWGLGPKNNCQDWADRARDEYDGLLSEPGGQSNPGLGPNMTPAPPNMSFGL